MVSGRPDDLAGSAIQGDERTAGRERVREDGPERRLLVAIAFRMLLPDEWIGRDAKQGLEVVRPQRPQLEQVATENGLPIE